jgi:hypothetical protein
MNFHRNTNSDKRSTRVTHHAKAPPAGSTEGSGSSRGPFRRALATRAVSSRVAVTADVHEPFAVSASSPAGVPRTTVRRQLRAAA